MLEDRIKELEKLGKPIVHCEDYKTNKYILWDTPIYEIMWLGKTDFIQTIKSGLIEEKYNILITDDFIFVKE